MSLLTRRLVQRFYQSRLLQTAESKVKLNKQLFYMRDLLNSDLKFISLLDSQKSLTPNDWKQAREELLKFDFLNGKNVDAAITNLCFSLENIDAFISYARFLKNNNYEINLYVSGRYAHALRVRKSSLTDLEKQEFCDMYDNVRKKYSILDGESCERFICGLCLTDRWEESTELVDMMKISTKISPSTLADIIVAAFQHEKADIGWKYLTLAAEENISLLPTTYSSYLEYCLKTFKDKRALEENLLKMLQYCKETEKLVIKGLLDNYLTVFKNIGYTHTETTISRLGKCLKCSHQLPAPIILKEEFEELSALFVEKVVVRENVYYNSSPKEFKQFMKFLEEAAPYDVVIDGLNVACCGVANKNNKERINRLAKVVEHFLSENKRILLLGRKHMLRWGNMSYLKHNTKMFLVDDSSFDDPHLLYATLYGGMKTCFLSGDLMRQHKCQLPKDKQGLFKRWQLSHQYMLDISSTRVKPPVKFQIVAQEDKNGWHVPYYAGKGFVANDSYDATTNWICLRK